MTGRRPVTNVPAQALYLMNRPFVARAAANMAADILAVPGPDADHLARIYDLLFTRPPTDKERERALGFLKDADDNSWGQLIQVLLASTEFRMLD